MLVIDKISRKPIYEQIVEGIEREIMTGLLCELEKLPSVRELSVILDTNPNTIQKAFTELDRLGIIISNPGRGCFVARDAATIIKNRLRGRLSEITEIARSLCEAGIPKQDVLQAVSAAYEGGNT